MCWDNVGFPSAAARHAGRRLDNNRYASAYFMVRFLHVTDVSLGRWLETFHHGLVQLEIDGISNQGKRHGSLHRGEREGNGLVT